MNLSDAYALLRGGHQGIVEWNCRRSEGEAVPDLWNMDLRYAQLQEADLSGLDMAEGQFWGANLSRARLTGARMTAAHLEEAFLHQANLTGTDLTKADMMGAVVLHANLSNACLSGAFLMGATFLDSNLSNADLSGARLFGTTIVRCMVGNLDLSQAILRDAILACPLTHIRGLNETRHYGPSTVAIDSIRAFENEFPEAFLRGCGLREPDLVHFKAEAQSARRYFSAMICYGEPDEAFADRLYWELRAAGVQCWKWDHSAKTGEPVWSEIGGAIRKHEKMILIASQSSLESPAVNREIERVLQEEDRLTRLKAQGEYEGTVAKLFPVRLDDYVFNDWDNPRKPDVVSRIIADGRAWKTDHASYERLRERLLADLRVP